MNTGIKINLDDVSSLRSLDSSNCHQSLENLTSQLKTAWSEADSLDLKNLKSKKFSAVYFCGMGGSAYAGRIAKFLFRDTLKVPFEVIDNYDLPASADENSLIFCASYSGNTEETVSCLNEAISRKLTVIGVTGGGKLAEILKRNASPVYIFKPDLNPSNQPRLGQGYMIASSLSLLNSLGLITISESELENAFMELAKRSLGLNWSSPVSENLAKKLALESENKIMFFIASDFLEGTIHAVRNPINETGKHFASYFILPELNHHLLEGLGFPEILKTSVLFILVKSPLYSAKTQKRFALTEEVLTKNSVAVTQINLSAKSRIAATFETIQLLSFVSFYLSALHGVNPAPVPWVDYFKKMLKS